MAMRYGIPLKLVLLLALYALMHGFAFAASTSLDAPTIREIYIDNQNIFDENRKKESGFAYRAANTLHVKTRTGVIEKYLLFKRGDTFNPQLLEESERILRSKRALQDAQISSQIDGPWVDIYVTTQDTWSLKPKLNYSHKGGVNKSDVGIEEDNLFGLGIRTAISYASDGERTSKILKLSNDNLLGQWHTGSLIYVDSNDGSELGLGFARPFYALDTRTSYGFIYDTLDEEDVVYDYGKEQFKFRAQTESGSVFWGFSKGLTEQGVWRHTLGITYEDNDYSSLATYVTPTEQVTPSNSEPTVTAPIRFKTQSLQDIYLPQNSESLYPYYQLDFLQDKFAKLKNFEQIGKTEDVYMGVRAGIQIGYGAQAWGNDQNRSYFKAYGEKAFLIAEDKLLFLNTQLSGRYALNDANNGEANYEKGFQNLLSESSLRYYHTHSDHFKGYIDFYAWSAINPDKRDGLYLDPETGMRAYPLYYLSGTHMQKMSFEERYYSNAYIFQILRVGAAVFYDIGRLTGNINAEKDGVYREVGVGLRLSNNRSSKGDVIHIDFSYPLDIEEEEKGWKFSIESKASF